MAKRKNRIGERYGNLQVISLDRSKTKSGKIYWSCKCDCGNTSSVLSSNLKKTKSCGCSKTNELSNKRFGKLTVIKRYIKNSNGNYKWECRCDCGNIINILGTSLSSGHTKSCGCIRAAKVNNNFFEKINIDNSYWAGLLAADGNIGRDKNYFHLLLSNKDFNILEGLSSALEYEGNIKKYSKCSYLRIYNKDLVKGLESNFNITPQKTFEIKPPKHLNKKEAYAFVVGYIDGDSYIGIINGYLRLQIAGTFDMLVWIRKMFQEILGEDISNKYIYKSGKIYTLNLSGKRALKVLKILSESYRSKMNRKWKYIAGENECQSN